MICPICKSKNIEKTEDRPNSFNDLSYLYLTCNDCGYDEMKQKESMSGDVIQKNILAVFIVFIVPACFIFLAFKYIEKL